MARRIVHRILHSYLGEKPTYYYF
ncbi:hypothetical protein N7516_010476 [Penicillium verrucosum]|nr:hypothetical protein N7516_010476 [Penicillium verrucosum]